MFPILNKVVLAPKIVQYDIKAPRIAAKAQPGQFVIIRVNAQGERIPLTIADFDRKAGIVTLVVQEVGYSSQLMNTLNVGESILDVTGPLGHASIIDKNKTVVFVAGGLGIAPVYPIARAVKEAGNKVIIIMGAKTSSFLIWEEKMQKVADQVVFATDDGSKGTKGFVTTVLQDLLTKQKVDKVVAIGPGVMMAAVAKVVPKEVELIVSLNSIMIDGTGMCGGCRVSVGGKVKFTCVDGPEFDGHQVDFTEFLNRAKVYIKEEQHICKIGL